MFILTLPFTCLYIFKAASYPHVSPSKLCVHFSLIRSTYPAHLINLYIITQKLLDQYKSWSPSLCNSLQCPTISSLSCPSPTLHSQMPSTSSSLNVTVQLNILITITSTTTNCININSDVSCVFYMILRHTEGGWSKAKFTTNQHLSCTIKTSRC